LRVLQENEIRRVGDTRTRAVNVRIIAATNKKLQDEVKKGNFREDLYYRINVVNIEIPPLRERLDDIPLLTNHFLEKISHKMNISPKRYQQKALDCLIRYAWPGNVRQLENICERGVIFSQSQFIDVDDLPEEIKSVQTRKTSPDKTEHVPTTKDELKAEKSQLDKLFLINILKQTGGNVMQAAKISGMDRSQIHHMMSKFKIDVDEFKS